MTNVAESLAGWTAGFKLAADSGTAKARVLLRQRKAVASTDRENGEVQGMEAYLRQRRSERRRQEAGRRRATA